MVKLYRALYKGKKYGRVYTEGWKAVMNACLINLDWEETE